MAYKPHIRDVEAIARRALDQGGRIVGASVEWDVAGRCSNPQRVEIRARPAGDRFIGTDAWGDPAFQVGKWYHYQPGKTVVSRLGEVKRAERPMWVDIDVKCRRCPSCLRARGIEWTNRAKREYAMSSRTWFGTLTFTAAQQSQAANAARKQCVAEGRDFDVLDTEERFKALVAAVTRELTLWLKRVRKESRAKLRYILVAEAHKSGLPHFHLLVHEAYGSRPVTHRTLSSQWRMGFSNFKLVTDARAASYVCKYLSKSALARVRASVRYGITSLDIAVGHVFEKNGRDDGVTNDPTNGRRKSLF